MGYAGGHFDKPAYEDVCGDATGHAEAVLVKFDAAQVSYEDLLKVFWSIHDPTQYMRQGPDVGSQYRSAIFYYSEAQRKAAEKSKKEAQKNFSQAIATEIVAASTFWPAEEYHQKYYLKYSSYVCHVPLGAIKALELSK